MAERYNRLKEKYPGLFDVQMDNYYMHITSRIIASTQALLIGKLILNKKARL